MEKNIKDSSPIKGETAERILYNAGHGVISRSVALKAMEQYANQKLEDYRRLSSKEDRGEDEAVVRAREIYPMANEDDYPDFPNVNRLNTACRSAFMSGFRYARKPSPPKEE